MKRSLACALLAAAACGTAHHARTLGKGNYGVDLEIGGPLTQLGSLPVPVPLPYALVGATYGITDRLDIHGRLHLTMAYLDVAAADVGATYQWLREDRWRPALSTTLQLYEMTDFSPGGSRTFSDLTENLSYLVHRRYLTYFGLTEFAQLNAPASLTLAPFVGEEFRIGDHYGLELELKYGSPEVCYPVAPSYIRPGSCGALFVLIGVNSYFGHGRGWAAPPSMQPTEEMIP
ncbi:MAG: hypothetical protein ACYCWW_01595 [Deltaproteobacteria bacterium]